MKTDDYKVLWPYYKKGWKESGEIDDRRKDPEES